MKKPLKAPAKAPAEITIEQIRAAVSMDKNPAPGETVTLKRVGQKSTLPIQLVINRLRTEHPETKFVFQAANQTVPGKPAAKE